MGTGVKKEDEIMEEKYLRFIKHIAENWQYETEYAGRMEDYCFYCGTWQGSPKKHDEECLHLEAVKTLEELPND